MNFYASLKRLNQLYKKVYMKEKDNICIKPWTHLVQHTNGFFSPCCKIEDLLLSNGKLARNLDEAWNGETLENLRKEFLDGKKPSLCKQCWKEEVSGNESDRTLTNRRVLNEKGQEYFDSAIHTTDPTPRSLDLKISNQCNLKCRMCSGIYSNQIMNEITDSVNEDNAQLKQSYSGDKWVGNSETIAIFKKWVSKLEYMEIYGGEPFLQKDLGKILDLCEEMNRCSQITLRFHTNGMVDLRPWFEILSKFKRVEIHFSLDDVGPRLEYQRKGSSWSYIQKNFQRAKEWENELPHNRLVAVFATFSIFNSLYIEDLLDWTLENNSKIFVSPLHDPPYLNISFFPEEFRTLVADKLKKITHHKALYPGLNLDGLINLSLDDRFDKVRVIDFFVYTGMLDRKRRESFEKVFPEIMAVECLLPFQDYLQNEERGDLFSGEMYSNIIYEHSKLERS